MNLNLIDWDDYIDLSKTAESIYEMQYALWESASMNLYGCGWDSEVINSEDRKHIKHIVYIKCMLNQKGNFYHSKHFIDFFYDDEGIINGVFRKNILYSKKIFINYQLHEAEPASGWKKYEFTDTNIDLLNFLD